MSATGVSFSSSPSTTVDPQQDFQTPVEVSPSLNVTDERNTNKGNQWETISTLSSMFQDALGSELRTYKGIYSLVGTPQPAAWERLRACLASVKSFYIDKNTKDDGIFLSPAILLNVQMELGKLSFFPNLRALHVYSIDPLIYCSPLFTPPSLKAVTTVRWSKWAKDKKEDGEAFENFLQVLPEKAPALESLNIDHPDKVFKFETGVFKNISRFRSIRTLHFQCPVALTGIDHLKSFSMLPHLEELQLAISWWGWIDDLSQKIDTSINLDSIQRLILSAPPHIFIKVVCAVQMKKLDCIIGECPSKAFWDLGAREIWETMVEKWPTARMALATFLWSEENDYLSFADVFSSMLSGALDLKSIVFVPSQANLIFLADPSANVALSDLGDIANELPALVSLSLVINASNVPSCDFKPLQHKLEQLTVYGAERVEKDKLLDAARYLHCLFPNLQGVRVKGESNDWMEINKLIRFSHQIAADERKRVTWLSIGRD